MNPVQDLFDAMSTGIPRVSGMNLQASSFFRVYMRIPRVSGVNLIPSHPYTSFRVFPA